MKHWSVFIDGEASRGWTCTKDREHGPDAPPFPPADGEPHHLVTFARPAPPGEQT